MQRLVMWLALACLALTAGILAWQARAADDSVPMIPLVPATRIVPDEGAAPLQQGKIGERPDAAADLNGAAVDPRPARLEVELRHAIGGAAPVPAPYRDVDLSVGLPDGETMTARVRTDERGLARFEIPGGDRCVAALSSGPAATGTVELRGGETVRTTLVLVARLVVQGTVVDDAGTPIADADLVLLPWAEPNGRTPRPRCVGRSGADGSFSVGLGRGGRLGALHERFAPSPMLAVPPATDPTAPPPVHTLRLVLPANFAELAVRVVDVRGKALARAEVEVAGADDAPAGAALVATPQRHFTDEDGRTTFTLRPGRLQYIARRRGHATARGGGEVLPGRTATLEIRLQTSCGVHGFVERKDGTRIAGARVWSGTADGDFEVTDADGAFRLEDLEPGVHELRAREASSIAARADAWRARTRLELAPGQIANWVAVLDPPAGEATLRGTVVDTDERPLPEFRVSLRGAGRVTKSVTDERGAFRAERPAPGPIDVLVYSPETPLGAFATAVALGLDAESAPLRVVVDRAARTATIVGRVVSVEQAPLPATIVCHHHERRETARFQAQTDGTIRVPRVPPGTLDVHVEHPGKSPLVKKQLRVDGDASIDLGLLVLGDAATLFGRLSGPGGAVPEQATVALQTKERRIVADYAAGSYRFDSVPPGQHVLQVQGTGVAPWTWTVNLSAGVALEQNLELLAGVPRRFVVRLPGTGEGAASLALRAPGATHTWIGTGLLRVDPDEPRHVVAEFVAWMAPGTYEAIAWCGETVEARQSVVFVAGDDSPVTLLLQAR